MDDASKRVLILIVAYNAEKTIGSVLSRIPVPDLPPNSEVLIIDDASSDDTFRIARGSGGAVKDLKVTVLCNPVNRGYGGNQKIGYEYAIENGFDAVALVHGDGQYAPEKLPDLLRPVLAGEADACFGSRMMERGEALKRGMPRYKYVGNRILSAFQNRVLGMDLSEFHSGYRIYAVDALKRIPFQCNTDDFHFDTEIIIQLRLGGFRIQEAPIPTYYGDEICYVNGLSYAWHVVVATLASRAHQSGILFQRKYDVHGRRPLYDIKIGYASSHSLAIESVRDGERVLDLACGPGHVARELSRKGCEVVGVDRVNAEDFPGQFLRHDLDQGLPSGLGTFDVVLVLDSVEHLDSPEALLDAIRSQLYDERTRVVVTTPNIGFLVTRFALLVGQFNYAREGILDLTHRRLFTFSSLKRLLEQQGYTVTRLCGIPAPFPKALGDGWLARSLLWLNQALLYVWKRMFAYQILAEAKLTPPLDRLLQRTLEFSREAE